jgi:N-acetylglucosaminyldiphosphoundecaprenol N-acetyl-beta-D-mannosaminyltransferase
MINGGKHSVAGVMIDAVDYEEALCRIHTASEERRPYAVTALAVHGVMTGVMNEQQKYRLNHFGLVVPDGQPVRWALNLLHGMRLNDRVYGPELSLRTIAMAEREAMPVYFYGSTQAVLDALRLRLLERFPDLLIAGMEPSQFRHLDASECAELAKRIVLSGAMITFVGLGCPRQEIFAYEMAPLLTMPLLAVGAAFDFLAGTLSQAPPTLQRFGLEWAYRLSREPRRLWRRYLYLNPYYLWMIGGQMLGLNYSRDGKKPMQLERYG